MGDENISHIVRMPISEARGRELIISQYNTGLFEYSEIRGFMEDYKQRGIFSDGFIIPKTEEAFKELYIR